MNKNEFITKCLNKILSRRGEEHYSLDEKGRGNVMLSYQSRHSYINAKERMISMINCSTHTLYYTIISNNFKTGIIAVIDFFVIVGHTIYYTIIPTSFQGFY